MFPKKKILLPGESTDDWREVTPAERAAIEAQDAKWVKPSEDLIHRFNAKANNGYEQQGAYNEATGFFDFLGLALSTEEAYAMDSAPVLSVRYPCWYRHGNIRSNFTRGIMGDETSSLASLARGNSSIEVLNVSGSKAYPVLATSILLMCLGCLNLKKIVGVIDISRCVDSRANRDPFSNCHKLEEVWLKGLAMSLTLDTLSLKVECLEYLIANAANTKPIVITVPLELYSKLTDESNREWHQVLLDALEKDITFTTPMLQ